MSHNAIQELCSGPDFAVGEIYGIRQWFATKAWWSNSELRPIRLIGHYSSSWKPRDNVADCRASRSFTTRFTVSPHWTPPHLFAEAARRRPPGEVHMIDIAFEFAKQQIAEQGIAPRDVERLEIDGGMLGGHMIAVSNDAINALLPSYTELGAFKYAGDGRFAPDRREVERLSGRSSRAYDPFDDQVHYNISLNANKPCDSVASPECTCGMYAYTDRTSLAENSYTNDTTVFGLIKGYGKVTVGTKGFRAEKADILAVTRPIGFQSRITYNRLLPSAKVREPDFIDTYQTVSSNDLLPVFNDALERVAIPVYEDIDAFFDAADVHLGMNQI